MITAAPAPELLDNLARMFSWSIEIVLQALRLAAGPRRLIEGPLQLAVWNRLRRMERRLLSLLERARAGKLRPAGRARRRDRAQAASARPPSPFPRHFAWLHKVLGEFGPPPAGQMFQLLEAPGMRELVAAAPQAGRVLRPLCWMLGIRLSASCYPWLALPPRPRVRKQRPPRPSAAGKEAPPPKPIDVTKLSSVAYGHFLHPENEKHPVGIRPPNRIGYARSRWPPKNRA